MQVELDARAVLQSLEADGVLSVEELFLGIDADIEAVAEGAHPRSVTHT